VQKKVSDLNRQKLLEEYEDSLFRLAVYDAAEKDGKLLHKQNEKLRGNPGLIPTEASVRKFNKRLNSYYRKNWLSQKQFLKTVNKIAVVLLIVLITFSTAMVTAVAFRAEVMNLLIQAEDKYTSFRLKGNNITSSESNLEIGWENSYAPTYIPEGFQVIQNNVSESQKRLVFSNEQVQNSIIIYTESSPSTVLNVDTENASLIETVNIKDTSGTVVTNGAHISVIWEMDSLIFMVVGTVEQEELIKIAESVQYFK
jgi:hypothetical protein